MTAVPATTTPDPLKTSDDTWSPHSPRVLPLPGEFVGSYRLIFELASGGMATIYLGLADRRAGAHRLVAVKRLHRHFADDANYRKMFLDEARIASRIRHPNVCAVFDYAEHDGTPYIAMEYLAGEPVSAIWKMLPGNRSEVEKRRRCALAARIVADACEALHAAHELRSIDGHPLNVVHRDVSPENLVVTYDGVVKLCDFGIAIAERQEHETEAGMLKGKYAYIQPEALRGERPDRRSDIFSLGVVLWELMTGERLFRRESTLETLKAVGETLVPAPSAVLGVASEFDSVVLRALAPDPCDRFATAREFGKALDSALALTGVRSGLGEVSEWMDELFPGGRAKKEQLIELVAKLYEPAMSASPGWSNGSRTEMTETDTVAVVTRTMRAPAARSSHLPAGIPRFQWPRWRRPAFTFALGALLGAQYFAPAKPAWSGSQGVATAAAGTPARPPLPANTEPRTAIAASGIATVERSSDPVSCETKIAIAEPPDVDADSSGITGSEPKKKSSDRDRSKRESWRALRSVSRPVAAAAREEPNLLSPAPKLELGSSFAGYGAIRLAPPILLSPRSSSDLAAR